jgi:hypothetical protein
MKAVEPNEPTMLIKTWIGVGIRGSSSARKRPAGDAVFCEFRAEGEDGIELPLQLQVPMAQAMASADNASFMRISIAASKVNARRKL